MDQDHADEDSPNSSFWATAKTEGQIKDDSSKSAFVPTVNAITSSQELQWMVQPAVLPSKPGVGLQAQPYLPRDGNDPRAVKRSCPGVIRAVGNAQGQSRRHLLDQDEEKRRLRRERNKLAAAKCRNRRTELTNHLQGESEVLERERAGLQARVQELQDERARLELMLEAHASVCSLPCGPPPGPATPAAGRTPHPGGAATRGVPSQPLTCCAEGTTF